MLTALHTTWVEFIRVGGGVAAVAHGSARLTQDIDLCYARNDGARPHFKLITSLAAVDLLGELTGGGGYEQLRAHTITLKLFGFDTRVLDLETWRWSSWPCVHARQDATQALTLCDN